MTGPGRLGLLGTAPSMAGPDLSAVAAELLLSALLLASGTAALVLLTVGLKRGEGWRTHLKVGIARQGWGWR